MKLCLHNWTRFIGLWPQALNITASPVFIGKRRYCLKCGKLDIRPEKYSGDIPHLSHIQKHVDK